MSPSLFIMQISFVCFILGNLIYPLPFCKSNPILFCFLLYRGRQLMVDFKVEQTSLVTHVMHFGKHEKTFKTPVNNLVLPSHMGNLLV